MGTAVDLHGRHLLALKDYSREEIVFLLDLAAEPKAAKREGREEQRLMGRNIALILEKDSTRTRSAFEVASYDQGANVTFIGPSGSHMGHKETVKAWPIVSRSRSTSGGKTGCTRSRRCSWRRRELIVRVVAALGDTRCDLARERSAGCTYAHGSSHHELRSRAAG
jgi:hypothetical protein